MPRHNIDDTESLPLLQSSIGDDDARRAEVTEIEMETSYERMVNKAHLRIMTFASRYSIAMLVLINASLSFSITNGV